VSKKLKILVAGKYIKKKIDGISIYTFLKEKGHNVYCCNEFEKIKFNKKYDLIISYGYGLIFNKNDIIKLSTKIINLHIGYLPFARGIYPILWSLIYKKPIGITFHTIENNTIDGGRIIFKKKITYSAKESLKEIHQNCIRHINQNFILKFNKIYDFNSNHKKVVGTHYFNRKKSKKLLFSLPKKWDTKASFLKNNSIKFKKIYKSK